jgi:molybdopterin synthase catalytic subunit
MAVRVTDAPFDLGREAQALSHGRTDIGSVVTFSGICRDEAGALTALNLECYVEMAEAELLRLEAEARSRWPLTGVTIIHRHGRIVPGEDIMMVAVASAHRTAAFEAAMFLMDYLKTRAPFWKSEERRDGAKAWVAAKAEDDAAAARW